MRLAAFRRRNADPGAGSGNQSLGPTRRRDTGNSAASWLLTQHGAALRQAEVLQELIQLAKDLRAARERGEANGMTLEEIAFYDALAENESAMEVMGDEQLRVIAHELLMSLRDNVTVDWAHRQSARARLRVLVKRILRKYGYPPDLQDAAVRTVLQQAEALTELWQLA